jgi:hypothetical protein
MIIALSFIGKLPSYIVEVLHQIRCFYSRDVYYYTDNHHKLFIFK